MVKRYKGGLMGGTEAVTSSSDARGMWGTVQAVQARNTGNWPGLLATETAGSGSGAGFANGFMTVSNVSVTDSSYNILNDTPNISTSGGYIKLTGRGFVSGCVVYVGGTPATSTTFISSTEVRAQIAAATSNTLMVYVVNPDGSTGIKLNSLVFSGTPTWVTGETLSTQLSDTAFSINFSATSDSAITAYTVDTGSSLPPGTTLYANGLFTGTVTGISSDTTYSFSVVATDTENQDTSRTFSVTVGTGDAGFYLTSSIFNSDGNVWVRDSSVNNAFVTVGNDTKPSAFSPYNYNQSVYFDGTGDYLSVASNAAFAFGTGDFTVECWVYITTLGTYAPFVQSDAVGGSTNDKWWFAYYSSNLVFNTHSSGGFTATTPWTPIVYRWYHVAAVRQSGTMKLFVNGTSGTVSTTGTPSGYSLSQAGVTIGAMSTPNYLTGYISNARLVNGVAVYTGSFTVPTTKLSNVQSAGTNISAITSGQTALLTCQDSRFVDNSGNAFTVSPIADSANKSFGPFTETDIITGSAYFDGTGDYLTIADNAGMELGAGDFCVECWIYPTSVAGTGVVIDKRSGGYAPLLLWRSTSTLQIYMSANGSSWGLASAVTVGALSVNRWYHVAIFRVGSSLYTSFNGVVSLVTASGSATPVNNATNWYIGTETNGSTNPWTGYIGDLRFVVGSSVYTSSNFTPPANLLSAITNTQFLSLQYRTGENNHRFVDESGLKHVITRTGDVHQGTFSPHSPAGWSGYFDGTGDYLDLTGSSNLAFGTSDWTIELWVYFNSVAGDQIIYDSRPASTNGAYPTIYRSTTTLRYYTNTTEIIASSTITTNTWYHVAVARASGTTRMFINGTVQATTYADSITYLNGASRPRIGDSGVTAGAGFSGYISNLRVVNGTGLYTANFTPATSALTAIANTQLLTLQDNRFKDNSTNAFAITRAGDVRIHAFSPFRASGAYNPVTHGGSAYFDGTGDYLTMPVNAATDLTQGDFTVEAWIYRNVADAIHNIYSNRGAASTDGLEFRVNANNTLQVFYTGAGNNITTALTISARQWYHVAAVRIGSTAYIYVNGLQAGTTSISNGTVGTGTTKIGADNASTNVFNGFISGLRVVKSQGLFTGNFAIPTDPPGLTQTSSANVAAMSGNVTLLTNFTHAGIVDYTTRNNIYTSSTTNTRTSNTQSKFGTGSLFFTGGYQYVFIGPGNNAAHPPLLPTIGDYTVEFWVYATASDTTLMCLNTTLSVFAACRLSLNASGGVGLLVSTSVANVINIDTGAGTFAYNTWQHIAMVRNGGTHTIYINGTARASSTAIAATTAVQGGVESVLGCIDNRNNSDFASFFQGYIDDFRTTRYARYTANFTPPTTAHLTR